MKAYFNCKLLEFLTGAGRYRLAFADYSRVRDSIIENFSKSQELPPRLQGPSSSDTRTPSLQRQETARKRKHDKETEKELKSYREPVESGARWLLRLSPCMSRPVLTTCIHI